MKQAALKKETSFTTPVENAGIATERHGLVGLTTRIRPVVSTSLFRASMERKMQRRSAAAMQDIVDEALSDWLKQNGYLE